MNLETMGIVRSVTRQWWYKINTKSARMLGTDGAIYPHVIKVQYTVGGKEYTRRKWIPAGMPVPCVGSSAVVIYREEKPAKAKVM